MQANIAAAIANSKIESPSWLLAPRARNGGANSTALGRHTKPGSAATAGLVTCFTPSNASATLPILPFALAPFPLAQTRGTGLFSAPIVYHERTYTYNADRRIFANRSTFPRRNILGAPG